MKIALSTLCFVCLFVHVLLVGEVQPDLTLQIPMRDGTELPTDLYLPSPEAKGLPCILLRSAAGRRAASALAFVDIAKAGYVVAIQDTRSILDTEGKTLPYIADGWGKMQDGYDTVEWLAKSPYTNGKIGTWGISAIGITQLLMAPSQPPHLKCQYVVFAAASLYHHGLYPGGLLLKNQAEGWLGYYAKDSGLQAFICQRPFYNEFWKQLNSLEVAHKVQVPGIHIGGWYDTFLQGTLSAFVTRQYEGGEGARNHQKLVIGPWTHFWPASQHFGDFPIPKEGVTPPFDVSPKRWFDHYLKGVDNGVENIPAVTYFVMGPFDGTPSKGNVWKTSNVWPVPAKETKIYFKPDSKLGKELPATGHVSYHYDPRDVIPTIGGNNLFLESGPKDIQSIEKRSDIIVFTTEPLAEDVEVTGPVTATLYFKTDQLDTDVVVRLTDVYPDGKSVLIAEGGYRLGVMCHQTGERQPHQRGQVYKVEVDLAATSFVFAKGHAIRASLSSSNYPRFEKNMNVGLLGSLTGRHSVAHNTLYMGEKYPSHLLLPIVNAQ